MRKAFHGNLLYLKADPNLDSDALVHLPNHVLMTKDGIIEAVKPFAEVTTDEKFELEWHDYQNQWIVPGFIDTHIHYPQTEMIAAYGEALLEWLEKYTFPTEMKFDDPSYAKEISRFFLNELLSNGTTTALVFGSVHKNSVEAFFEEAEKRNLRMICGKVMMDRNAPEALQDTPESSYQESKELIEKWHGKKRLSYAVTPRFAITSSPEQLQKAGRLLKEFPGIYLHTHLSENKNEIEFTQQLFPKAKNYLDVYKQANLLTKKSVFAHCIHLKDEEWNELAHHQCNIAFCPTSNLFLGSGLFNLEKAEKMGIDVGMGTDVGAGTSFNMLSTLNEAYKVTQLRKGMFSNENKKSLSPLKAFYLATLGGAKALSLEDKIGQLEPGMEADFNIIHPAVNSLQKLRMKSANTIEEQLFVLQILGHRENITATYIQGEKFKLHYDFDK